MEVKAEVQIHTARATVWQVFVHTAAWSSWHTQIRHAVWLTPVPWHDNAVLQLQVTPLAVPITVQAHMKSVVPESLVVWESRVPGLTAVHVFEFTDSLGGCQVREKETFHGPLASGLSLLHGRQSHAYARSLHNLKLLVESGGLRSPFREAGSSGTAAH